MTRALLLAAMLTAVRQEAVLENPTVAVDRLHVDAGGAIDLGPRAGGTVFVSLQQGSANFVPGGTPAHIENTDSAPLDVIAIRIKVTRPSAASPPSAAAPPGITRTTLIDNAETRVVRVRFATGGREPVHTHPNDLVTVQLTPGRISMLVGTDTTTALRHAGFVRFLPRDVVHAYASADRRVFEILSVTIK